MLSYPRTDELFEGGTPPSAWFYAFEEDRDAAVQDLLLGAADLGPFQTLDPWAVALPWLQGFSNAGFPADFDAALTEWIVASWGKPIHPASYGSAALTARAWESTSLIIANFDGLPISAGILRDCVLRDREFLAFMGEGPSLDPAGRAWQALAQYQEDDSLFGEWNHVLALDPGVPWYHGQYGLMGVDLLPGNRGGMGIPPPLAYGLRRFGNALLRLVMDGYLNEGNARREFGRLSRWAQSRYPFRDAWRSVWRQLLDNENDPLAPWVFDSLGADRGALDGKAEEDKWQLPRATGDWFNRVQQIRLQLKRPTRAIMDAANTLLSEMETYYYATSDSYDFVRSACNLATALPDRWIESWFPWLEKSARFDPASPYPATQLTAALLRIGNLGRAEQVARSGVYHFPLNVFAFTELGQVLKAAGKLGEAESVYRETMRRFPGNVVARTGLGEVLKVAGKLGEAESVYRETIRRFPNSLFARTGLGEVLKVAGRLDEAESVYRETVQRFPNDVVVRTGLGKVLKAAGELTEAESVFREAVQRFPRDQYATKGLQSIDRLRRAPGEVDLPDSDGELVPDFDGELVPDFDAELIPDPDEEVCPPSAGTVRPTPSGESESLQPPEMRTTEDGDLGRTGTVSDTFETGPEKGEPADVPTSRPSGAMPDSLHAGDIDAQIQDSRLLREWTRGAGDEVMSHISEAARPQKPEKGDLADVPPSRPSDTMPGFLRASDIDVLIQDSNLLRKWARGTGEEAMSHIREEARSLLNKLERFLGSSPAAVMESSLLLIETQDIQAALRLLDGAAARYPGSKRVQYALARTRREAARQASQERHPLQFDSPEASGIPRAWAQLVQLEPVLLPSARLGLVRSLPYLTDGQQLKKAQRSALGQLAYALRSLQPDSDTRNPRSYWAYRVGELVLGDRAAEIRGASEVSDDDVDLASKNCEQNLLTLNGLEEDLLLHYHVS